MAEIGEAPFVSEKLKTGQDIFNLGVAWHEKFKAEKWADKPSYHDEFHIIAMDQSIQRLLKTRNSDHHFNIDKQLASLNQLLARQSSGFFSLNKDELKEVMQITTGTHDLGNICEDVTITTNGIEPVFLEKGFASKNAETRSQTIAEKIINFSDLDPDKKNKYILAVKYLIGQTELKYNNPEEPFAVFMRACDQVGANLLSQNTQRTAGLRLELLHEFSDLYTSPDRFYNFVHHVLPEFVPDLFDQNQILNCWGFKTLPDKIPSLPMEKMSLANFSI